jgi:hypothetical protein
MKSVLLFLGLFFATTAFSQVANPCKAFEEGCWTLIGASNGVELYVTHKKYTRPGFTNGFNITVYSRIVNTNDYAVTNPLGVSTFFYFKEAASNILTLRETPIDKDLDPRQTVVRYQDVFTNLNEIMYSQIKSFRYIKKP